jgi:hypothetical protein
MPSLVIIHKSKIIHNQNTDNVPRVGDEITVGKHATTSMKVTKVIWRYIDDKAPEVDIIVV